MVKALLDSCLNLTEAETLLRIKVKVMFPLYMFDVLVYIYDKIGPDAPNGV